MVPTTGRFVPLKRPPHWRLSGATQTLPIFEVADAATDVGETMVEFLDFKRVDAEGRHSGQWVSSYTLMTVLSQIEAPDKAVHPDALWPIPKSICIFRPFAAMFLDYKDGTTPIAYDTVLDPKKDVVLIVSDHDNNHFFTILVETFAGQKAVHVFDSLIGRKDAEVKHLLSRTFSSKFAGYNFHNYTKHNFTKKPLQSGASCGPWSLWIGVAFIFDINHCRRRRSEQHGRMRVAAVKMTNDDVLGFWKHLTF